MRDVAGVAGVSIATVSRVLSETGDVRPDLADKVRDAVRVLDYRRDLTASTLRRSDRASGSLGLVLEDVSNPFFSAVHRGVEEVARARGVLTFSGSSDEDAGRERELADAFAARGVDGLVIAPCGSDQSYLLRERRAGTALVFVDRPPRFIDGDAVVSDNAGGAAAAVGHLLAAGHERIALLGDRASLFTAMERRRGYRERLAAAGLEGAAVERMDVTDIPTAERVVRDLLHGPAPPTALFTGQNLITVGALRALRDLGLERRVALVGFDDLLLADLLRPGVTVVRQDPYAIGRRAAELLFERLGGARGPSRTEVMATELVPRGSGELAPPAGTGAAATGAAAASAP
jgi:LacI family transcriptional regulator